MKIKKKTFVDLWKTFERLNNGAHQVKFSYFIAKNRAIMKEEIEILMELTKPTDAFKNYDMQRAALANELADKDENGKSKIAGNAYVILENQEEFQKKLKDLQNANKDIIADTEKRAEEFKVILEEEVEYEGYKTIIDNLPDTIEPSTIEMFMQTELIQE